LTAIALLVSLAGIYAVLSFIVARRTTWRALRVEPTEALRAE
jgi:hypothetical protein